MQVVSSPPQDLSIDTNIKGLGGGVPKIWGKKWKKILKILKNFLSPISCIYTKFCIYIRSSWLLSKSVQSQMCALYGMRPISVGNDRSVTEKVYRGEKILDGSLPMTPSNYVRVPHGYGEVRNGEPECSTAWYR